MINLVEMLADADGMESANDQPCRFGNRVSGHAVYCHNDAWSDAPRKCRRSWYTGGREKDEDCEGFSPNPDHPSYAHLKQAAPPVAVVQQPVKVAEPKKLRGRKLRRHLREQQSAMVPVRFNIERMETALASPSIAIPPGLSREEKRDFILSHAGNANTTAPEGDIKQQLDGQ